MADTLLDNIRAYLIGQGVVRDPRVAGSAHPMYRAPRDGALAPGEPSGVEADPDLVVSAYIAPGVPPRVYEGFWRTDGIGFWIRSRTAPLAIDFEAALRTALHGQQNVMMGNERIVEARIYTDMRPLVSGPNGFTFITGYLIQHYFPALAT